MRLDKEVAEELETHRRRVGRELSSEEILEVMKSPTMHAYIRWRKQCREHDVKRLQAEGWVQMETASGVWEWRRAQ